jgi:hypothetical protein
MLDPIFTDKNFRQTIFTDKNSRRIISVYSSLCALITKLMEMKIHFSYLAEGDSYLSRAKEVQSLKIDASMLTFYSNSFSVINHTRSCSMIRRASSGWLGMEMILLNTARL